MTARASTPREFYRTVFGGEFIGPIARMGEVPPTPGQPALAEDDRQLVMHIELAIIGGQIIMGTDAPASMGFALTSGNNMSLNLEPDTRAETDRLFQALAEGGKVGMPLMEMFWGDYFGSLVDRFGIRWMLNCRSKV